MLLLVNEPQLLRPPHVNTGQPSYLDSTALLHLNPLPPLPAIPTLRVV